MNVTLRPPPLGNTHVPIKMTGDGQLEIRDDGLFVTASEVASKGRGLFLVLALIGSVATMVVLRGALGLEGSVSTGVSAGVGGAILLPMMKKPAQSGAPISRLFPWKHVKKVTWDATTECLVVVIKGTKPKGGLYIVQPNDSDLQKELVAKLA